MAEPPPAPVFRLPAATKHNPDIDTWLDAQREDLRPLLQTWFQHMRQCGDDVTELMHDGCPTACVGDAAFAYVAAWTHHINIGFFHGAHLNDPANLLEGTGKHGRHTKLKPGEEIDTQALAELIHVAYRDIHQRLRG